MRQIGYPLITGDLPAYDLPCSASHLFHVGLIAYRSWLVRFPCTNGQMGYGLETGTAAELRLALTITLTLTDTGFAVLTLLLGYTG